MLINTKLTAIVEYLHYLSTRKCIHRNSKVNTNDYLKTPVETRRKIKRKVRLAPPRKVYSDVSLHSNNSPRDLKQVQNYVSLNKNKFSKKMMADNMQRILNTFHDSEVIQEANNKPPCIILYTKNQLSDLINMCKDESCRNIIDRTFNLGPCFV